MAKIGSGMSKDNVSAAGTATLKYKRDKINASLAFSDATLKNVKSLKDVVATADYKLGSGITLNGKYDLATKKYQGGATWEGSVKKLDKNATVKAW